MAENRTEAELREHKVRFHEARAKLPFEEKLKIIDDLQEAALSFAELRRFREDYSS